ncbi:hypothetical protein M011DRAFT_471853 [Sporormia fimetaria CBS 119925]|uniref:Cytokinesis regulator n=1 Tax=Sporormia fimetaria CBS 119925 TaxID=1340428 RepID=A0A6A6UZK3_9PLEO|nr:hypothetical protein M011DRAFT_471853 [Sporormia fimetaria CBS 119925]
MQSSKGSFAQRMASAASSTIENWDDDLDFQIPTHVDIRSDVFSKSTGTAPSLSSRLSVRSESNAGDDDWQMLIAPHDDRSTTDAISTAKQAGIPIPTSVPPSALLGGSIKRLGKRKSARKLVVDDDWGQDLELPPENGKLELKPQLPRTPFDEQDDFEWGEGSLGIRFAGARRDTRGGRSSTASAMSPSMGSCMTLESEDDDMAGLLLPTEPLDFKARLEKLTRSEQLTPDHSPLPAHHSRGPPPTSAPVPQLAPSLLPPPPEVDPVPKPSPEPVKPAPPEEKEDDFLDGLDIGSPHALDTTKLTLNPKLVVKKQPSLKPSVPVAARAAATITFTDKPSTSRIPRPLPPSRTRLTPVYETGAAVGSNRQMPTTTSAQLLRAKRSAPALRNTYGTAPRPPVPFLPAGSATAQSHHVKGKSSQGHLRRDSDPRRPVSPSMRSYSRLSIIAPPETPKGQARGELSTAANSRGSGIRRSMGKLPGTKKIYGEGNELDAFDDLPISAAKEKQFEKQPKNVNGKTLRHLPGTRLPMPDRMVTPQPQTPRSPPRVDHTPRFARDTAASRIAREQRLAGTRSRGEGPISSAPINWKAQVAARSPHTSPVAQRKKGTGQRPKLIFNAQSTPHLPRNEKGMTWNPILSCWEGNEDALIPFSHPNTSTTTLALTTASTPTFAPPSQHLRSHDRSQSLSHNVLSSIHQKHISSRAVKILPNPAPVPSPPRPALISQISRPRGVQIENGMFFDPVKMTWIPTKKQRATADPRSPIEFEEEEDPFAGIEDLKDPAPAPVVTPGTKSRFDDNIFVGEEFDLGPSFIRRQREEEKIWRRRTEAWITPMRDNGERKPDGWRWEIRALALDAARR